MKNVIMIKYGEIYLKGNNRNFFENLLLKNIKYAIYDINAKVRKIRTRYVVSDYEAQDEDKIVERLLTVFGIHSISRAVELETSKQEIFDFCKTIKLSGATFKVETNRADKSFEMNSMQLNCELGGIILDSNSNAKVDVHKPQQTIFVDIRENGKTYIYYENIKGAGGMPVGSSADGVVMLSGGIDSPVACYKMAKRGMYLTGIHFASYPYTSNEAKEKVVKLAKLTKPYTHMHRLLVVSFTKIQEAIHKNCKDEYMITLMRRFMVRISERLAKTVGAKAIVTGEDLGQVASQTVESITSSNSVAETMPDHLLQWTRKKLLTLQKKLGLTKHQFYPTKIVAQCSCQNTHL